MIVDWPNILLEDTDLLFLSKKAMLLTLPNFLRPPTPTKVEVPMFDGVGLFEFF